MGDRLSTAEKIRAHTLFEQIYARHSAGCCLHVVLDDNNYGDSTVRFCLGEGLGATPPEHDDCEGAGPPAAPYEPHAARQVGLRGL